MDMGVLGKPGASRVDDDQLSPPVNGVEHPPGHLRMSLGGVGARDQDHLSLFDFIDGISHRAAAKGGGKTCHRGCVSESGAVVDVISLEDGAGEFLQEVVFFVGAFGRR